jgi:thioredoxin reductase
MFIDMGVLEMMIEPDIEHVAADLPVLVIGAGPVGLAAAAHLVTAGETPIVVEAGHAVAANVRDWGHVRVFSPWRYNVDERAAALLAAAGWSHPDHDAYPTGGEIVRDYLEPLAAHPAIAPHLRLSTRVIAVSRSGFDVMKSIDRELAPFVALLDGPSGEQVVTAKAVIDASGTWATPNPLGAAGLPALGERRLAARIRYGVPDVLGVERDRYAGRSTLVVGSGHSAFNAVLDLATLAREAPGTRVVWAVRRRTLGQVFGGGENDALVERGRLGQRVRALVDEGLLEIVTAFQTERLTETSDGIVAASAERVLAPVDELVATTGARPDLSILRELRLDLDQAVEAPTQLAPLIDPNYHSCGTVRPHGAVELAQPDPGLYLVGAKSYGRAPTVLMLTGYEQVRSVVAAIRGDWDAARQVHLELPETGVCNGPGPAAAKHAVCCGG